MAEEKVTVSTAIADIRKQGYFLQKAYEGNNVKKVNGIALKLLDDLRANNRDLFMNRVLNSYMYANKPIPHFFDQIFDSDERFQEIGLAFTAGLIAVIPGKNEGKNKEAE